MNAHTPLHLGLIGAGRIGRVHAATLTHRIRGARLVAVSDPLAAAASACADDFGIPRVAPDYREILADPAIQAVLICTPTDTHVEIITAAAAAGKHIFCEKPIALDLAQIDRAVAAVNAAGVQLQIGFNRRFDPNFARMRQAILQGEIGTPHMLRITSRDPAPPPISYVKSSGGIFLDMTIHDWDMARYLIGSEIAEVCVQAGVLIDPAIGEAGDYDTAVSLIRFANGVIGTIDNSRRAVYGYDQRCEVFGSAGAIEAANNYPNNTRLSTANAVQRDLPLNFFMQRYTESYAAEMEAFVGAVGAGTDVPVNAHDGRMAVVVGMAAQRSAAEHRNVQVAEVAA